MLNSLRIQNFKSWQDTGTIQFGSLTGFFGTNSSGKTSILQFLLMLKQTVESSDRAQVLNLGDERSYVELGTMYDILYDHIETKELSFSLSWTGEFISNIAKISNNITLESSIDKKSGQSELNYFKYSFADKFISINRDNKSGKSVYLTDSEGLQIRDNSDFLLSNPYKFYGFPMGTALKYPMDIYLTQGLSYEFERSFQSYYYLGPLRDYPKRLYSWSGEQSSGVGNRGERVIAALLASRNEKPNIIMGAGKRRRSLEQHVAYWLKELGLIHSFEVRPIAPNRKEYEVRIKRTAESAEVFLTDVGFGVSQLLPVLVLLFYVPEGSTIILEQPEIHLHPAVQAGLADVFIDAIKRRNVQIILESHSEHLLQRLQLRMAEKGLNPEKEFGAEQAKLYFTSIEQGHSKLTTLQLDDYGNINNWPEGFFGDTIGEAAAMMKAEMKRKMQQQ